MNILNNAVLKNEVTIALMKAQNVCTLSIMVSFDELVKNYQQFTL